MKIISVDYDDTYTADPSLFSEFIEMAKRNGHYVIMVTSRNENTSPITDVSGIEIFYTNGRLKEDYMNEIGLTPNIWVDDSPQNISNRE
jgi:hypothetical protein